MLSQDCAVIQGQYFRDLLAQPAALRATVQWLAGPGRWRETADFLVSRRWKRIVLTGMGASFHALHPLNLRLIAAGHTPVLMETSELVHHGRALFDEQTLIILASQSGRSAETLRLLDLNRVSPVMGITNTAESPLALRSDLLLQVQAGPEATVSCKTYVSTLLTLQWLGAVAAGENEDSTLQRLEPAAHLVQAYWGNWPVFTRALMGRLQGKRHLFLAGRGESLAAAGTGALIIKEAARFHAEGMSSAAFRHGPMEMLQQQMLTVILQGDPSIASLNQQLRRDLEALDGQCELIGEETDFEPLRLPRVEAVLRPVLEVLPMQMMSLALAALGGHEAGRFLRASKVTATE